MSTAVGHPPAKCRSCGAIVPAYGYAAGHGASFAGCAYSPCPVCDGECDVLDGTYSFRDHVVEILSAPKTTIDALVQAGRIMRRAKAAGKSDEEALTEAAKVLPALGALASPRHRGVMHELLIGTLWMLAGKVADPVLDKMVSITKEIVHAAVSLAVDQAVDAREAAAAAAGVTEPGRPTTSAVDPARPPFANAANRLQRELLQRYRSNGLPGSRPPKTR